MAKIQPTVRYFKIKSKEGAKIVSVYWSQNEKFTPILKNGEVVDYKNSQVRNYICNNEDGFLHIHTRQMYGEKVKVSVFERDRIGDDAFIISRDVLILDNRACVVFSMQELLPILYLSRKAWLEGDNFDLVAVVEPVNKWIRKKESTAPLYLKIEKRSYTPAKSTVEGTRKFVPGNVKEETKEESKEKGDIEDMITYHIYAKGHSKQYKIEKHMPKINKCPQKYKYIYHTSDDVKHEICKRIWIEVPEMVTVSGNLDSVPKGYDEAKTYTYPSDEGIDAEKAYYYYKDGKLDYVVVKPKKGEKIKKYTSNNSSTKQILNIPEEGGSVLSYNNGNVKISFTLDLKQTARIYCGVDQFAVLIGVMADTGLEYISAGCTSKDATGYPSVTHVNGYSFDFSYKQNSSDQTLVDAMQKWAPNTTINVGFGAKTGKHCSGTKVKAIDGHDTHIHWGPNKTPTLTTLNV